MTRSDIITRLYRLRKMMDEVARLAEDNDMILVVDGQAFTESYSRIKLHEIDWSGSHCVIPGQEDFVIGNEVA